jgi:iron(II)-dependent oxidoreductase
MRKALIVLAILGLILAACASAEEPGRATAESKPTLPEATQAKLVPTNTPVPPPPTPTPAVTPTPAPETEAAEEAAETPAPPSVVEYLIEIPAGPFTMGSDTDAEDEAPAHEVDLPAFKIDLFEVANADFAKFVEATGYQTDAEKEGRTKNWRSVAEGKDNHPVVFASWNDAVAFCEWLGKRLPTEAEWEKAARGSDERVYPWGDDYDPSKANVKDTGLRGTAVVGSFGAGASPYGVEDMAGNVWEWTADWYEAYPGSDYQSDYFGERFRVLRGGAWFETADFVRTTVRNANIETAAGDDVGFRCAR